MEMSFISFSLSVDIFIIEPRFPEVNTFLTFFFGDGKPPLYFTGNDAIILIEIHLGAEDLCF